MDLSRHRICIAIAVLIWTFACFGPRPAVAADLTLREIVTALWNADPAKPLDFSGKELSFLDLSELDFKRANLSEANLLGANLTGANLASSTLRARNSIEPR